MIVKVDMLSITRSQKGKQIMEISLEDQNLLSHHDAWVKQDKISRMTTKLVHKEQATFLDQEQKRIRNIMEPRELEKEHPMKKEKMKSDTRLEFLGKTNHENMKDIVPKMTTENEMNIGSEMPK